MLDRLTHTGLQDITHPDIIHPDITHPDITHPDNPHTDIDQPCQEAWWFRFRINL